MRLILLAVFSGFALAAPPIASALNDDEFLSQEEYQLHLWHNPRGIGCNHCHGERGEEVEFSSFFNERQKQYQIKIPSIKNTPWERFYRTLAGKSGVKNIMPDYHLTEKEIKNLYLYIKKGAKND